MVKVELLLGNMILLLADIIRKLESVVAEILKKLYCWFFVICKVLDTKLVNKKPSVLAMHKRRYLISGYSFEYGDSMLKFVSSIYNMFYSLGMPNVDAIS